MAMEQFEDGSWNRYLMRGDELTLIPFEDEPMVVTHVFLVDPESAAGQGVVSVGVEMGTHKIKLAELSSEITDVELEIPVKLHEEFRLFVAHSNADAETDEDALVVHFWGYTDVPYDDTDEESEEEEEEEEEEDEQDDDEATSSEDDDESIDEDYVKVEKSDAEVDGDVATNPGGDAKDV